MCESYIDYTSDLPCPIYDKNDCIYPDIITSCNIIAYDTAVNCIRYICKTVEELTTSYTGFTTFTTQPVNTTLITTTTLSATSPSSFSKTSTSLDHLLEPTELPETGVLEKPESDKVFLCYFLPC